MSFKKFLEESGDVKKELMDKIDAIRSEYKGTDGLPKSIRDRIKPLKDKLRSMNESSQEILQKLDESVEQIDELTGKGSLEKIIKNARDTMNANPVSKQYIRSYKAAKSSKRYPDDRRNSVIRDGMISKIQRATGAMSVRDKTAYADNAKDFLKDKIRRDEDRNRIKRAREALKSMKESIDQLDEAKHIEYKGHVIKPHYGDYRVYKNGRELKHMYSFSLKDAKDAIDFNEGTANVEREEGPIQRKLKESNQNKNEIDSLVQERERRIRVMNNSGLQSDKAKHLKKIEEIEKRLAELKADQ